MSYQSNYQSSFNKQQQSNAPAPAYSNQQSSYSRQENTSSYSRQDNSSYAPSQNTHDRSAVHAQSSSANQYEI